MEFFQNLFIKFDYISRDVFTRASILMMVFGGFVIPIIMILIHYLLLFKIIKKRYVTFNKRLSMSYTSLNDKCRILIENDTLMLSSSFSTSSSQSSKLFYQKKNQNQLSKGPSLNVKLNNPATVLVNTTTNNNNITTSRRTLENLNRLNQPQRTARTSQDMLNNKIILKSMVKSEIKIAKFIFMVLIFFCLAWVPYATFIMLAQYGHNIYNYITPYTTSLPAMLAKMSAIINPLLYTLTDRQFKLSFYKFYKNRKFRNNRNDFYL